MSGAGSRVSGSLGVPALADPSTMVRQDAVADGGAWEWLFGGHFTTVDFVDAQHGWAAGYGAPLLRTTDGGVTWRQQQGSLLPGQDFPPSPISRCAPWTSWAVTWDGLS